MHEINAVLIIALRDFTKLIRDRTRLATSLIFPLLFIGILGSSLQSNLPENIGYSFITFVFTGVLGQTLFQSTAAGVISLIEDRENDFSQEIFVSPISRYSIIIGKILGETMVSLSQVIGVVVFGFIIGVPLTLGLLLGMFPFAIATSMLGGAFGMIVLSNLGSQRSANQIFPFIIFPQFFLAGVFNPIAQLPPVLLVLSRIAPMTYAVDLMRSVYYKGTPEYSKVVIHSTTTNLAITAALFTVFLTIGTFLFVRNERNK